MKRLAISLLAIHCSLFALYAQDGGQPTITATFDRDTITIGDQFTMTLTIEKDIMQMVGPAELEQGEIAPGVELMREFPLDTVATDGRRQTLAKRYLMTIWEEGRYNLGLIPALYADKNVIDTLWARDSLRIVVRSFDIDLEKDKPYDIKPPAEVPFRFGEISGWLALGLLGLALVGVAMWLVKKYRGRLIPLLGGGDPSLPPHVEAIRRLEALRNQKLPQNGRHKQYYSGLVDILRTYLERRFGIGAMEMTSAEILDAVNEPRRAGEVDSKRYDDLAALLTTADLVKFAKFIPDEATEDAAYYNAYYFVEETKAVVEGRAEESEKEI
jgi:hypothetical protein